MLALGAGTIDAFLTGGHSQPRRFGAEAALADIVECRGIGVGACALGLLTIG